MAQEAIKMLERSPVKMALLAQTDVIFIDELSMIDAGLFSCIDYILRMVMKCDVTFGGKLVICTGDHLQLPPVNGRPIWISQHVLSTFYIVQLNHKVRAAQDPNLGDVIELLRLTQPNENDAVKLCDIIQENCTFVETWNDIPIEAMRVVSTKKAEKLVTDLFVNQLKNERGVQQIRAKDEMEVSPGCWIEAPSFVSKSLNKKVHEDSLLQIFEGALCRMTYNRNRHPYFSQGQMGVIRQLPDLSLPENQQKIVLSLVPPGKEFNPDEIDNWEKVSFRFVICYCWYE